MTTERKSFLIFLLTLVSTAGFSQDVPSKLAAFNEAIGKEYNVSNKGKVLIIEGFREGKQVKVDKVNVFDLELETLKFTEEDKAVSVNCDPDLDGCVNRVLLLDGKKSYRERVVFGVPDGVSGEEIVNKLKLLLNDMYQTY